MKATKRQKELMALIIAGDRGDWLDIDSLIEKLTVVSQVATKQSLQCSIRKLERHAVIVRDYRTRRGRNRVILVPTGKGYALFGKAPSYPGGTPP